jgi:hypothetical protein
VKVQYSVCTKPRQCHDPIRDPGLATGPDEATRVQGPRQGVIAPGRQGPLGGVMDEKGLLRTGKGALEIQNSTTEWKPCPWSKCEKLLLMRLQNLYSYMQ